MRFENRVDAGSQLAERLDALGLDSPLVLGLPRGGIPVAAAVASVLGAPLEAFVARKVGAPGHEEFGIGAVAEGLDDPIMSETAADFAPGSERLVATVERSWRELSRQVALYRGDRPLPELAGRHVVLVDDGLATGATAHAALVALRRWRPGRLVLAVPVCAPESAARLAPLVEDLVSAQCPARFIAVGQWYNDFSPTTDQEVIALLSIGRRNVATGQ
ncbi:MAG TPA: phosphoribosyltransferase family protein [Acidimicrobiales bacterium]|nr:phosphoribosyltransferase family protein [Acidimicrobiales bacterium]